MKIKTVRIENFRSTANAEFDASGFNVFVGQNNHGNLEVMVGRVMGYFGLRSKELSRSRIGNPA